MLHNIRSILVSRSESIFNVMMAINKSGSKFALVVDRQHRLLGIVTDGDIRRGFLKGCDAKDPIEKIMNASPMVAKEGLDRDAMLELLSEKFAQIPVVDNKGRVKGVITYNDKTMLLDVKSKKVCVVGLGFVGLTFSLVLSDVGFKVCGYDINRKQVDTINRKRCPFHEEEMVSYLQRYVGNNFTATSDFDECEGDIYIITVGTPVDKKTKIPNIKYVEEAARAIGAKLKKDDLVILRSTVPVGTTRKVVMPILNKLSGLAAGIDYYLAFAPERTIAGKAIQELRKLPQVIGGYEEKSKMLTDRLFREVTSTIIDVGSLEAAEMVKILNNTFRDVKFAYANEMALVCKQLGLDMVKLVQAANQEYVRDEIPMPSPGVGGVCLKKDPYILMDSCKNLKHKPNIVKFSRQVNEFMPYQMAEEIGAYLGKLKKRESAKIFVMGFAFKGDPETSDTRDSTTLDLIACLRDKGYKNSGLFGYDPLVSKEEIRAFGVRPVSIKAGFKNADVVVIMNNHKSYKKIDIFRLLNTSRSDCLFVDGWYAFEPRHIESINNVKYLGVGCGSLI